MVLLIFQAVASKVIRHKSSSEFDHYHTTRRVNLLIFCHDTDGVQFH